MSVGDPVIPILRLRAAGIVTATVGAGYRFCRWPVTTAPGVNLRETGSCAVAAATSDGYGGVGRVWGCSRPDLLRTRPYGYLSGMPKPI